MSETAIPSQMVERAIPRFELPAATADKPGLASANLATGEPKLLARLGNASSSRSLSGLLAQVHVLRKGERIAAGRAGEEMLSTVPTDGGYRLHQFRWEAQGTKLNAPLDPTLIVEFQSGAKYDHGQPIRPKVTDEQATQLFDAVVNSIRLRPSAGGTLSAGYQMGVR